jgi:hypothetical protein
MERAKKTLEFAKGCQQGWSERKRHWRFAMGYPAGVGAND